jgi:hypothetical protein
MFFDLFREGIRQPSESTNAHSHREVLPLGIKLMHYLWHGSLRNLHEAAYIILGVRRKGNVDFSVVAHKGTPDLRVAIKNT